MQTMLALQYLISCMFYLHILGVAHDSYISDYYWSVQGGQGRIYVSNSSRNNSGQVLFPSFRRNPFSLKLDWVAKRLFWVEDGPTVRRYGVYNCMNRKSFKYVITFES